MQTENRLYGLGEAAAATGRDLALQAFVKASTEWQQVCNVVPGGTNLPYHKVTTEWLAKSREEAQKLEETPAKAGGNPVVLDDATIDRIADRMVDRLHLSSGSVTPSLVDKVAAAALSTVTGAAVKEDFAMSIRDTDALLQALSPRLNEMIAAAVSNSMGEQHNLSLGALLLLLTWR
jgi:hypothetical protein